MVAQVKTAAFWGLDAQSVDVQVLIAGGLPHFQIVGLPDKAVAESKERIRGALQAIGLSLPPKRITVNLVPADLLKEGSHFDLPIALGLLIAMGTVPQAAMDPYLTMGELGLDGRVLPVSGVLSASLHAAAQELHFLGPADQADEAVWAHPKPEGHDVTNGTDVIPATSLLSVINHLNAIQPLTPASLPDRHLPHTVSEAPGFSHPDLKDIRGQETAKRALEIAASGGHNLLMIGPPGSGKSMLAERLPGILPPLTASEALDVTMVQSAGGLLGDRKLALDRPYRAPHHSASLAALTGGGQRAKPGEVTLAHHGVLFLDELPEFSRAALDALRQPMETGNVTVARANAHITYPAQFQLVAAMNPCRCGYLADANRACRKAPLCGEDYQARVSGPIYDRMDLIIEVPSITARDLALPPSRERSGDVRMRVEAAHQRQRQLNHGTLNGRLSGETLEERTRLGDGAKALMNEAAANFQLSARGYYRILRVARTIADMAGSEPIERAHLAEAIAYRTLPRTR